MALVASRFGDLLKTVSPASVGLEPEVSDFGMGGKGKGKEDELSDQLRLVGKWLSDWHLLAFLDGIGMFDAVSLSPR